MLANQYPESPEDRLADIERCLEALVRSLDDEQFDEYMTQINEILREEAAENN